MSAFRDNSGLPYDIEAGAGAGMGNADTDTSVSLLEGNLAQLQSFLDLQVANLTALKVSPSSNTPTGPTSPIVPPHDRATVDARLQALQQFVDLHLKNIQALRDALSNGPGPTAKAAADYRSVASEFDIIVVTATFTSAVLVAFMALMNDFFPAFGAPLLVGQNSLYRVGFAFGLAALGINLGVAVMAAVNSALVSYYDSTSDATVAPIMKSRVLLCVWGQFLAAWLTGVAFILLTLRFDPLVAATAGAFYMGCVGMSIYHMQKRWNWINDLCRAPLVIVSITFSTLAWATSTAQHSSLKYDYRFDAWTINLAFVLTGLFHLMALIVKPRRLLKTMVPALFLCAVWGGSVVVTMRTHRLELMARNGLVICRIIAAVVEAITMAAIAVRAITETRKLDELHRLA